MRPGSSWGRLCGWRVRGGAAVSSSPVSAAAADGPEFGLGSADRGLLVTAASESGRAAGSAAGSLAGSGGGALTDGMIDSATAAADGPVASRGKSSAAATNALYRPRCCALVRQRTRGASADRSSSDGSVGSSAAVGLSRWSGLTSAPVLAAASGARRAPVASAAGGGRSSSAGPGKAVGPGASQSPGGARNSALVVSAEFETAKECGGRASSSASSAERSGGALAGSAAAQRCSHSSCSASWTQGSSRSKRCSVVVAPPLRVSRCSSPRPTLPALSRPVAIRWD